MAALPGRRRAWRRYRVSFRRMSLCIVWRLGFRQFSFRHITRVPRRPGPDTWARRRFAGMRLFRSPLGSGLAIRPTNLPSSSSRLRRGYNRAPRGALVPGRFDEQPPCVPAAGLGDRALAAGLAGAVLARHEPEIAHQPVGVLEPGEVADRDGQPDRREGVDPAQASAAGRRPPPTARWRSAPRSRSRAFGGGSPARRSGRRTHSGSAARRAVPDRHAQPLAMAASPPALVSSKCTP